MFWLCALSELSWRILYFHTVFKILSNVYEYESFKKVECIDIIIIIIMIINIIIIVIVISLSLSLSFIFASHNTGEERARTKQ